MEDLTDPVRTFNTPLEAGLRTLFLLAAAGRRAMDIQRLLFMDYLLVHSGDVDDGPDSLHPATPSRKGELLVRRALLQDGLELMRSRELVERRFQSTGIAYRATRAGAHLTEQFESRYAELLRERAAWAVQSFGNASNHAIAGVLGARLNDWNDELITDDQPGDYAV